MVTPLQPQSAVADVMMAAAEWLKECWELDLWTPGGDERLQAPVPVFEFAHAGTDVVDALRDYDLVVYVLGDSPRHAEILALAHALPGLVVLHDASLTNLLWYSYHQRNAMNRLDSALADSFGPGRSEELEDAARFGYSSAWFDLCASTPLLDVAVKNSLGVVVHSGWMAAHVDGHSLGHVTVAPLPVPSTRIEFASAQDAWSHVAAGIPDDSIVITTLGAVNVNRCLDRLLEAVAIDDRLRGTAQIVAAGPVEAAPRASFEEQAIRLGLEGRFHLLGTVSEAELVQILDRSDICAVLRDPVLEGQSGSVLTQMRSGTPVVVYDHAHYAELPDDAAVKVDPAAGATGLAAALRRLADDEPGRVRLGIRGKEYVTMRHTGMAYGRAIQEAGELAMAVRPLVELTTDLAARLRRLDLDGDELALGVVSEGVVDICDLG